MLLVSQVFFILVAKPFFLGNVPHLSIVVGSVRLLVLTLSCHTWMASSASALRYVQNINPRKRYRTNAVGSVFTQPLPYVYLTLMVEAHGPAQRGLGPRSSAPLLVN